MKIVMAVLAALGIVAFASAATAGPCGHGEKPPTVGS